MFLNSVRLHFHFEWFSVILRLNAHESLAFVYIFLECTLPRESPIANRVFHKRQRKLIDVINHDVKIFLTTYCRTTSMAYVNFTSLLTSLITCHHCVSFMVALVICKLQRILKGFMSLVTQRVFNSMMRIMQPANLGLACCILCCRSQSGQFLALDHMWTYRRRMNTCVQYNHAIRICTALLWRYGIIVCCIVN